MTCCLADSKIVAGARDGWIRGVGPCEAEPTFLCFGGRDGLDCVPTTPHFDPSQPAGRSSDQWPSPHWKQCKEKLVPPTRSRSKRLCLPLVSVPRLIVAVTFRFADLPRRILRRALANLRQPRARRRCPLPSWPERPDPGSPWQTDGIGLNASYAPLKKWWAARDSNSRHPACKAGALTS